MLKVYASVLYNVNSVEICMKYLVHCFFRLMEFCYFCEYDPNDFYPISPALLGEAQDTKRHIRTKGEPHNLYGQRAVTIWIKSLRKSIPLSCSLAICFLACHLAREAILPTDIVKWSLEGKIPYFAAFVDIGRQMGENSRACPVSVSVMFKPSQAVSSRRLESLAASIAQTVGLSLPPVNFYGIASRYLKQLSLPVEKILSHACRIYEWSMPPDLYLSINEFRLPTRVCVLSIVIVAIRILYNIHGFGSWEGTLLSHNSSSLASDPEEKLGPICNSDGRGDPEQGAGSSHNVDDMGTKPSRNSSHVMKSDFSAEELLKHLESKRNDIDDCYGNNCLFIFQVFFSASNINFVFL